MGHTTHHRATTKSKGDKNQKNSLPKASFHTGSKE